MNHTNWLLTSHFLPVTPPTLRPAQFTSMPYNFRGSGEVERQSSCFHLLRKEGADAPLKNMIFSWQGYGQGRKDVKS